LGVNPGIAYFEVYKGNAAVFKTNEQAVSGGFDIFLDMVKEGEPNYYYLRQDDHHFLELVYRPTPRDHIISPIVNKNLKKN